MARSTSKPWRRAANPGIPWRNGSCRKTSTPKTGPSPRTAPSSWKGTSTRRNTCDALTRPASTSSCVPPPSVPPCPSKRLDLGPTRLNGTCWTIRPSSSQPVRWTWKRTKRTPLSASRSSGEHITTRNWPVHSRWCKRSSQNSLAAVVGLIHETIQYLDFNTRIGFGMGERIAVFYWPLAISFAGHVLGAYNRRRSTQHYDPDGLNNISLLGYSTLSTNGGTISSKTKRGYVRQQASHFSRMNGTP